jgi:hypothetical protein
MSCEISHIMSIMTQGVSIMGNYIEIILKKALQWDLN